ncbi:MAG: hypothetical protein LWY06_01950 [Firmicutes bacterium]|nr:hypothetical protein [Bacillota bacterium]
MDGPFGMDRYYERFYFLMKENPCLYIGHKNIEALTSYWRGFNQAVQTAYEEDFFPGMSCLIPFGWYCASETGVEERRIVEHLRSRHPDAPGGAFEDYLDLILTYIRSANRFVHKFGKMANRDAFIKKVRRWMKENPEIPVEHIVLAETANADGKPEYKGFVVQQRLNRDNPFEKKQIEATEMILGIR